VTDHGSDSGLWIVIWVKRAIWIAQQTEQALPTLTRLRQSTDFLERVKVYVTGADKGSGGSRPTRFHKMNARDHAASK
jgi:hypothetical protein